MVDAEPPLVVERLFGGGSSLLDGGAARVFGDNRSLSSGTGDRKTGGGGGGASGSAEAAHPGLERTSVGVAARVMGGTGGFGGLRMQRAAIG